MIEIVPKITDNLVAKLSKNGFASPHLVPVEVQTDCEFNECWANVPRVIARLGGQLVSGRIVWADHAGRYLHLEAHAVWKTGDGALIDVSPKVDGEKEIVFVGDAIEFKGHLIPSRYIVSVKNNDFRRWAELQELIQQFQALVPSGTEQVVTQQVQDWMEEQGQLTMKIFSSEFQSIMQDPEYMAKLLHSSGMKIQVHRNQ